MNMGCSTSSPAVTDANKERTLSASIVSDNKDSAKIGDQEKNGNMDSNTYPASEAFIIPLSDEGETKVYTAGAQEATDLLAATVRKQPPKRIQELIQQAAENETTAVNLQDLEDKLEKAEERRKEYLQQKVTTIQKTTQMLTQSGKALLLKEEVDGQMVDRQENQNDNQAEEGERKN